MKKIRGMAKVVKPFLAIQGKWEVVTTFTDDGTQEDIVHYTKMNEFIDEMIDKHGVAFGGLNGQSTI